jgi:MFS family permease
MEDVVRPARTGLRTTIGASLATALSAIPPFLLGSLLPTIRPDLEIDTGLLGVLVSAYFLAGAVAAIPGGRLAERLGGRRSLVLTASVTAVCLILIATVVGNDMQIGVVLVVAGFANGMVHPAGNLALVTGVGRPFQGRAFGVKQAAAPFATLFAGLALPTIGLTLGWRWGFIAAVALLPVVVVILPGDGTGHREKNASPPLRIDRSLVTIATASALAFGAATTVGAFLVDSVVTAGGDASLAGVTLTVASASCIGVRLFIGWHTDRMTGPSVRLVALLMAIGAAGFGGIAALPAPANVLGAVIAMAAGWGWSGLLYHAVATSYPEAPASATAVATTGNALGAAVGPLSFGLIAAAVSFDAAWSVSGLAILIAAGLMLATTRSTAA